MLSRTLVLHVVAGALGATLLTSCDSGTTLNPFRFCGNGVIDPGEQCDDGDMNSDTGACLTTCKIAFCGDGWVYVGKEECDLNNFLQVTCKNLGFDGGTMRCTAGCAYDTSACGPAFTPTPTAPPTATPLFTETPTPTPTPGPMCGNGLLEPGETCAECPADCTVSPCDASAPTATFTVNFAPPLGQDASSVTVLTAYRSSVLNIPGSGFGSCGGGSNDGHSCANAADCPGGQCIKPQSRVKNTPRNAIVAVNNLGYAARVVISRSPLPTGELFTVEFDTCLGAPAPTTADVSCSVEGCSSSFGPIDGCTCTVTGP